MTSQRAPRCLPWPSRHLLQACALGGLLLAGACSTRAPHPLLDGDLEQQVGAIDLAAPPTVGGADMAPPAVATPLPSPAAATDAPASAYGGDASADAAADADAGAGPLGDVADDLPLAERDGPQRVIGVADVRSEAISNNLEIKTELIRPSLLREDRREAEARFLPTAFARYNYSKFDEPGVPPTRTPNGATIADSELGVLVPLQTGGNAQISMPLTRTDFGIDGVRNVHDAAATFSLSQPLLRDAGRAVNLAPITVARLLERQQDANTKLAILNVLAGADRFYWNLYTASRIVAVRLEQYRRAQEQERQATRLAEEGVVPAIEVVRARAGVARRVADVIIAENQRRQVEREVKRAMNHPALPVSGNTTLLVSTRPEPVEILIDREAALALALENRMELIGLELQLAVDSLGVDVTRNQKLPNLALDYSFRYLGAGNELDQAFDQIGRTDFANQSIGLTLEVPLGNQAREARYNRAVLQRALTSASHAQQAQIIERQVLDTIDQLDEAWQRILAAREETLLAARNFLAEQRQFRAGVRTSTDVLIAADFLADAQAREVNAMAAYEIAKIDLAFVTGTLLGSGNVRLVSFDENHDIDEVAARAEADPGPVASTRSGPTQASIAAKLDRLGVKAPSAEGSGLPPLPARTPATVPPAAPLDGADPAPPRPAPASGADALPGAATPSMPAGTVGEPAAKQDGDNFITVGRNDTLWSLAAAHRPRADIATAAMVAALVRANPALFPDRNPDRLIAGERLRLPRADAFVD